MSLLVNSSVLSQQVEAPSFEVLSVHSAHAVLTNNAPIQATYQLELYLGVLKSATTGLLQVTLEPQESIPFSFTISMPGEIGTYQVYLDVYYLGALLNHHVATTPVQVVFTPSLSIGDITWS